MKHMLFYILLSVSTLLFAQQEDDVVQAETEQEQPVQVEQGGDDESQIEADGSLTDVDEAGPSDRDFKPSEEISEDFPVPLPADI